MITFKTMLVQLCASILILAQLYATVRVHIELALGLKQVIDAHVSNHTPGQEKLVNATAGALLNDKSAPNCSKQHLCVVSSNRAVNTDFGGLIGACIDKEPETEIVVLGLQEYWGTESEFPTKVKKVPNLKRNAHFKRRHVITLGNGAGSGHFCYSRFMSSKSPAIVLAVAAPIVGMVFAGPIGAVVGVFASVGVVVTGMAIDNMMNVGCGQVAVAVYSLKRKTVQFDMQPPSTHQEDYRAVDVEVEELNRGGQAGSTTMTTFKGSLAMKLGINGQQVIIASTHAEEGVRGKHRGKPQKNFDAMLAKEHQRVRDFRKGLDIIKSMMWNSSSDSVAIVWVGDFNARSMDPDEELADYGEGDSAYDRLLANRDILGAVPEGQELTTFTKEIEKKGLPLMEVRFPPKFDCPTYQKARFDVKGDAKGRKQFKCNGMIYNYEKPPSWTDRMFTNRVPWITHSALNRVTREVDHDSVFAVFVVQSPGCEPALP